MAFTLSGTDQYQILTGTAGVNPGVDAAQFQASGKTLRIIGAFSLATVATGVHSGMAGAGSSSTSLNKPAGAAAWTSNDLVGKFLRIAAGGGLDATGAPVLRPILSNTGSALSVNAVAGMDSTTRFQIVTLATLVDEISADVKVGIRVASCFVPVEIYGLDFTNANSLDSLIDVGDSTSVLIAGCNIDFNTANPAFRVARSNDATINHCALSNSGDVFVDSCFNFGSVGLVAAAGGVVSVEDVLYASVTKMTASASPSQVLSMVRVLTGQAEVTAGGGAATPIYLESVSNFTAVGGGLQGTGNTGGSTYGIEIEKSGQFTLTGSTITGAGGDVLFMNYPTLWSDLSGSDFGIVEEHAGAAVGNSSYSKSFKYGNYLFQGETQFAARSLWYGIRNPAQITQLTALGTTSAGAYVLIQQEFYRFDTVPANSGCRIFSPAVTALPGVQVVIQNKGANALKIYPPTGGQINGGGVDTAISLAVGATIQILCTSDDCLLWVTL